MKKFFYSIDRDILKDRMDKMIKDKSFKHLLFKVIDSANKIDKKGLPLGNTSSQVLANIYMDKLDKYCKCKLSIKYYCRYMDDIFIVARDKETAQRTLGLIRKYAKDKLNLECNAKKTKIFPINQGVNMVGFKIQTTHKLLRNESKNNMKKKIRKLEKLYINNEITKEKAEQILNSWLGHAQKGDCYNMINSIVSQTNTFYYDGSKISVKGGVKIGLL